MNGKAFGLLQTIALVIDALRTAQLRTMLRSQHGLVLTIHYLKEVLSGGSVREQGSKMFPPALWFGNDIFTQMDTYGSLCDSLNKCGANISNHSCRNFVIQFANGL